jgi:hypothetical protein
MAFGSPSFCSLWFATAIVRWPYLFAGRSGHLRAPRAASPSGPSGTPATAVTFTRAAEAPYPVGIPSPAGAFSCAWDGRAAHIAQAALNAACAASRVQLKCNVADSSSRLAS